MGARVWVFTLPLSGRIVVYVCWIRICRQISEDIREELETQGVLQLRSGRHNQLASKARPLTPHFFSVATFSTGMHIMADTEFVHVCPHTYIKLESSGGQRQGKSSIKGKFVQMNSNRYIIPRTYQYSEIIYMWHTPSVKPYIRVYVVLCGWGVRPQDREVRTTYLFLRCWLRARIPQIVYQPKTP